MTASKFTLPLVELEIAVTMAVIDLLFFVETVAEAYAVVIY